MLSVRSGELLSGFGLDAEGVEDGFLFVSTIATGVDSDGGKLSAFTPTLESEG